MSTRKALGGAATGAAAGSALGPWGIAGGAALGGIAGLFDNSDQEAMDQLKQNQALYGNLQTPNFDQYKPDQYQVAGQYDPEKMQGQTIGEDPALKTDQNAVLMKMAGLSNTGLSDVDQMGYLKAQQLGNQISSSGNAAALQNAEARGMGGSGMEFGMREQASQDAAQRAQEAALQQASDSARQRAMYTQAYGSELGNVRGQDFNANAANAGILNNFNMMNTQNANQAQQYNLGNKQNVMNMNTQNANQAQQYNNNLKQQGYQDQYQKVSGEAGANQGMATGYAAQGAANQNTMNNAGQLGMEAGMLYQNSQKKQPSGQDMGDGVYMQQ